MLNRHFERRTGRDTVRSRPARRSCVRVGADGTAVLTSRNGNDFTDEFAVLVEPLAQVFDGRAGVLDGEIVAYNAHGEIDFQLLEERRGHYQRRSIR